MNVQNNKPNQQRIKSGCNYQVISEIGANAALTTIHTHTHTQQDIADEKNKKSHNLMIFARFDVDSWNKKRNLPRNL